MKEVNQNITNRLHNPFSSRRSTCIVQWVAHWGVCRVLLPCHMSHIVLNCNAALPLTQPCLDRFCSLRPKMGRLRALPTSEEPITIIHMSFIKSDQHKNYSVTSNSRFDSGNLSRSTASTRNTTPSTPDAK